MTKTLNFWFFVQLTVVGTALLFASSIMAGTVVIIVAQVCLVLAKHDTKKMNR